MTQITQELMAALRDNTLTTDQRASFYSALESQSFQQRVLPWLHACFGEEISNDKAERNHRFLEESLELVQACGCTQSEAHQLVDYVFGRPVGEVPQEAGGAMVTLAALCLAQKVDIHACGETELARIWTMVEAIRAKQAAKPKHSPLPVAQPYQTQGPAATMFHDAGAIAQCQYCKRYTLDRNALGDRQPVCTCGKNHGWSGSFVKPGPDAQWHGQPPGAQPNQARELSDEEFDALWAESGRQYGKCELGNVRLGWAMARAAINAKGAAS